MMETEVSNSKSYNCRKIKFKISKIVVKNVRTLGIKGMLFNGRVPTLYQPNCTEKTIQHH